MQVREVVVGTDHRGRPMTMYYFHVEEVLASMRVEPTLRDHWVTRAEPEHADVEVRLCNCRGPCQVQRTGPCKKASTPGNPHGVRTAVGERVYLHAMDSDMAIDAQRRMVQSGHPVEDPKNVPVMVVTGEDKVRGGGGLPRSVSLCLPPPSAGGLPI